MDQADFPWRSLGALLVEDGLLTPAELERALAEQRRSGRLLGQILVDQGHMTAAALARALSKQHGVELQSPAGPEQDEPTRSRPRANGPAGRERWRPLGALMVERGLLTEAALQDALEEKHAHTDRRLGEILVERGHVTGAELAWALAEQHGLDFGAGPLEVTAVVVPVEAGRPSYQVFSVVYEQKRRTLLYEGPNLLDAADFACDYVDREQPAAVEIERRDGDGTETVWTYSKDRAEAAASSTKSLVETFGFDPTRWGSATS